MRISTPRKQGKRRILSYNPFVSFVPSVPDSQVNDCCGGPVRDTERIFYTKEPKQTKSFVSFVKQIPSFPSFPSVPDSQVNEWLRAESAIRIRVPRQMS